MIDDTMRVATTEQLIKLNDDAIREDFNRSMDPEVLKDMADPDGKHVLIPLMLHEHKSGVRCDPHIRCRVFIKRPNTLEPEVAMLDVAIEAMNVLPSSTFEEPHDAGE